MTTIETWLPVFGYEEIYEVSDHGHVRRIGSGPGARVGRLLKNHPTADGYHRVVLTVANRKRDRLVHALVAEAFICPRPAEHMVNHINSNRADNRLANLEWVTASGNQQHAHAHGFATTPHLKGETNPKAKLTDAQATEIRERFLAGVHDTALLSADYGVSRSQICRVVRGDGSRGLNLRDAVGHLPTPRIPKES